MKESTTYQAILEEGEARAGLKGERRLILMQGTSRFGPPSPQVTAAIEAIDDLDRIERLALRLLEVASWEELLADD